jgi:hypothetical protein
MIDHLWRSSTGLMGLVFFNGIRSMGRIARIDRHRDSTGDRTTTSGVKSEYPSGYPFLF